jgi:surfeit locus 1 family protein
MAELLRALVGRRWRWVTLVVLALMLVLARLGLWQLDRLAERRAANAQLAAALSAAPIDLNAAFDDYAALAPDDVPADLADRDVTVAGEYDFAQQRVIVLQNWNGQPGVHLLTPLVLAGDGDDAPWAVLVNRGWIPDAEREAGHAFAEAVGPQTVAGYVALTETLRRRTAESVAPATPGDELFRVDIAALQEELPYRLAPFYVMAAPAGEAPAAGNGTLPVAIAKEIDLSEGPHLGYAMQWFIFSLGLGAGYVLYVYRSLRREATGQPAPPPFSA